MPVVPCFAPCLFKNARLSCRFVIPWHRRIGILWRLTSRTGICQASKGTDKMQFAKLFVRTSCFCRRQGSVLRVAEGPEPWPDFDSSDFIPNRSLDFGEVSRLCPQPASRATLRRSGKQAADRNGQDARKLHFPNRKQARRESNGRLGLKSRINKKKYVFEN